jgi:hypothetical protein
MSLQDVALPTKATGEKLVTRLHDRVTNEELDRAETTWKPRRLWMKEELMRRGVAPEKWPPSLHWNWQEKYRGASAEDFGALGGIRGFGVEFARFWQGLLAGTPVGHTSRLDLRKPLVYVDFLESAPWNWDVPEIDQQGFLKNVGLVLIGAAVQWSIDEEYRGRVGLHALDQARGFYGRIGFRDLGWDADKKMHYMELEPATAAKFLAGVKS